ncbi:MAG TPA: cupin domain-containing protein [Thermoplasmata archaeon]|nr:cupin domain-containing protein [Thermoplasmata archaeon]
MTGVGTVVIVRPGRGTHYRIGPDHFRTKGGPRERTDAFAVIESEGRAGVPGPPPHVHRGFEEAWYILEGRVRFTTGRRTTSATPGTYLLVPRGVAHTFEVEGRSRARWLGIFSPARYVGLVQELGDVLPAHGPPDPARIRRLFAKYDSALVGATHE